MSPRARDSLLRTLFLLVGFSLLTSTKALGHDVAQHLDPELLTGWRTWLHLTVQWTHLLAFALWLGLTAGVLLLGIKPRLDHLLYSSWILFLVFLATGTYNMEWSAGIAETPSLLLLPFLEKIPYGVTYAVVLTVKVGLYALAVSLTFLVTLWHLRRRMDEARLRQIFLIVGATLSIAATLAAAVLLFYHEVADLWPTLPHSLGGVMGPDGPRGQNMVSQDALLSNGFWLLATRDAWTDIGLRWLHLLGFGIWLGGSAWALAFGGVSTGRYLLFSWASLIIQTLSGIASMVRWTPFYLPPYIWNLSRLSEVRFGRSYTLFMAGKHLVVIASLALLIVWTVRYLRNKGEKDLSVQPLAAVSLLLGLAVGYIMMIVLLLHEGVDHAL
ncbi:MAG: hypothetical protein HYY45_01245 [Deltaproteobacteria bacterium]|nr:hypothetical protein [Deltaproteobacteria bacterium]